MMLYCRSLLLMALPNEHQLTFNQYADAQSMFIAIKARFGGNDATKKTQKALLKQQYENFNATSSESLDSIFNRLQKLVSRLAILGVDTSPEDLNVKFLRSLPSEWDTHVVVWMNKPDFETMGLDDLYNNFKIVEQKVKRTVAANNDDKNLAFLTTTSTSSTNSINTGNTGVSTGNSKVNTASAETSTASFSDATAYAFLSSQPQGSQLVHEDLEQIHDDDLEEMDLKWNMALLSMRARKFYQRTGRKIVIDGSSTAGYDKSKVECFNCHKMGHFARECRVPRSKENRNWNQASSSKAVRIEDASEKAMCAIDGGGFDWSDMAEDEIQANMALMAFTDSEVSNDKSCSKSCLLNYEALKKQYDDLLVKLDDTAFKASTYKRGLSILEAQVVKYKESEVLFSEEIALLKRSVGHKDYLMGLVKTELEKVKEEKEGVEFKLAKFEKSSKDLDDLLASQVTDKNKRGFGYNAVPSPHPLILNRPTPLDLSYSGLEEFKQPEVNGYGPRDSSLKPTTVCDRESNNSKENTDDSLTQQPKTVTETSSVIRSLKARENSAAPYEDWVSDDEEEVELSLSRKGNCYNCATKKESVKPEKPIRRSSRPMLELLSGQGAFHAVKPSDVVECSGTMSGNIANLLDFKDFDVWMLLLVAEQMEEELLAKVAIGYIEESIVMAEEAWVYKEFLVLSTSSQQDQDCIVMPIWKDASYFDDASLKSVDDAQIQDQDGTHDDCSLHNNGIADQQVNTASPKVNTGSREVSTAVPESSVQTKKIMKVSKALSDPAWVEAMQEELLQFKLQNVWVLVDLPKGYRAIVQMGLQKQERMTGDSHQNNARLLPKDILMMKGIDYNEVFAPSG
ncbi:ribonuclease H-like domain-containing protein [Tanacetum coccineum]|uniref:Ribonuclease H-like domain-containing protein n=1 Tax=Tanacetum coccineum TaxID=301880 RepID=A0ABQ5DKW9_9ASTR